MRPRRPYIIAEAGSCHEGRLEYAIELVEVASSSDCDAIKFQFWSSPDRMRQRRQIPDGYGTGSIRASWLAPLAERAHEADLDFVCSVFLPEDVLIVEPHVDALKISSFEALDPTLVNCCLNALHVSVGPETLHDEPKPLFISTGMQTSEETRALAVYRDNGVILMHCVSAYPCPIDQANLGVVREKWCLGYSDHTKDVRTGGWAVMAGAEYLEVHFKRGLTEPTCPDFPVSLYPGELDVYVKWARAAYTARGEWVKTPQPAERENMRYRVGRTQ